MDIPDKLNFIYGLIDNVKTDIIKKVKYMPEKWDGIELRWYISERFNLFDYGEKTDKRSERYRRYKRAIIAKGL